MYTRVVQIKAPTNAHSGRKEKSPLVVENGEVLTLEDEIRRLATVPDGPRKGLYDKNKGTRYYPIGTWKMQVGKDITLRTIHQAGASLGQRNKLTHTTSKTEEERGEAARGPGSVKKARKCSFIDTQSSNEDEGIESNEGKVLQCMPLSEVAA